MVSLAVGESDADTRLDAFLAAQIDGWSRARLQRLIEDEDVLVNGKPAKASYKLRQAMRSKLNWRRRRTPASLPKTSR